MNVWMVISTPIPPLEGIGFYVWNLARHLTLASHKVNIVTRRLRGENHQEVIEGITIYRPFYFPVYPFHVYLHGFFVSRLLRKHSQEIDIIHYHEPLVNYQRLDKPSVATVHTSVFQLLKIHEVNNISDLRFYFMIRVRRWIAKNLLFSVDQVTSVSHFVADSIKKNLKDISRVEVMWNAIDHAIFHPANNSPKEDARLLYVGRISQYKGIDDLLDALYILVEDFPKIILTLVGQGDYRQELEKKVQKLGLDNHVAFLGQIHDRQKLADIYRTSTIFVLPSYNEGMPTVVLEAMACGLPVVATNVAGIQELIENGAKCSMVPMKNPGKLSAAIQSLLLSPALRREYAQKSHKIVVDKFSWDVFIKKFICIYQQALDRK